MEKASFFKSFFDGAVMPVIVIGLVSSAVLYDKHQASRFYDSLPSSQREIIQRYDANKDGILDKSELQNLLRDYDFAQKFK